MTSAQMGGGSKRFLIGGQTVADRVERGSKNQSKKSYMEGPKPFFTATEPSHRRRTSYLLEFLRCIIRLAEKSCGPVTTHMRPVGLLQDLIRGPAENVKCS